MRIRLFAFALAATVLTSLSTRADYTFNGPGLFTDTAKWSSRLLPTNTVDQNIRMKGHCGATNVAERLQGGKWCHIGYGGQASWLDVKDCDFYFATLRISNGGNNGVYTHDGGSAWFSEGINIGHEANYAEARVELTDVAVTNANKNITVGYNAPKDGGAASLKMTSCDFVNNGTVHVQRNGTAEFRNCDISKGLFRASKGSLAIVDSRFTSSSTGAFYAGHSNSSGLGAIALTNTTAYVGEKIYVGGTTGGSGLFDLYGSVYTNRYQVYIGNGNGTTGTFHVVGSTVNFQSDITAGYGASSQGELIYEGPDNVIEKAGNVYVASGSNSTGRVVFDGVDWSKCKITSYKAFASGVDSRGYVEYRNIATTNAYFLALTSNTANSNGLAQTTLDNAHYSNTGSSAYFGRNNSDSRVILNNGASFEAVRDGDIWIPNQPGARVCFFVTNSPAFVFNSTTYLKHEKDYAQLHFAFHDSSARIATNAVYWMAKGTGAKASFSVSGDSLVEVGTVNCYAAGESVFNLDGGALAVTSVSSGSQIFNFNGGALRSRSAQSSWTPSGAVNNVCEGGAVFDARHNVTIPGVLRHGGTAAKDGGVTKKGAATLTLSSSTQEFTGDIVVLDGILDMTAVSGYTLAAGQKIGGAGDGTLKVGSGFTAGGVRYDAAWTGGFTVDGDVSFAPGSTVDVTGVTKETEPKRITVLRADSISGAENISAANLPNGWKLRASATSLSIGRDAGLILIVR